MNLAHDRVLISFRQNGYAAPVPIFDGYECAAILARLRRDATLPPLDWTKGRAATSPAYFELATDERLLDLVTALIGEDVLLWGAMILSRKPGQVHHWHTDIESASSAARTVSVWIGLAGTEPRSSLKVVPYSHEFGVTIQQVMQENGSNDAAVTDEDIGRWARQRDDRSSVAATETRDGQAVVFDGRLWHSSDNRGRRTRYAALLQYATPATPIRIPRFGSGWPFEFPRGPKPPCIVVSGHAAQAVNRLTPGPVPSGSRLHLLSSRIHILPLPVDGEPEQGWRRQGLFRGTTRVVEKIGAHVSTLEPGVEPHPPHRHEDEEILLVLDGEAELVVETEPNREQLARHQVRRGAFAYYPANVAHTIRNVSSAPVTYLMFKWTTSRGGKESLGPNVVTPPGGEDSAPHAQPGRSMAGLLKGETRHLRQLGAHATTLSPGAGYEPHVDAYDVAIVVLSGTVETLGERVGPNGLIFCAAGEPHGMRNVGDGVASYLVFEFRGGTPRNGGPAQTRNRRLSERLRRRINSVRSKRSSRRRRR